MNRFENSISYRGEVTARLSVDSDPVIKTLKNAGLPELWKVLAMTMAGVNVSTKIPKYFNIVDRSGNTDRNKLYRKIVLSGIVYDSDKSDTDNSIISWNTTFKAVVTKSDRSSTISNKAVIQLCDSEGFALAEIEDSDGQLATIVNDICDGVDAIFEWKMTFSNQRGT